MLLTLQPEKFKAFPKNVHYKPKFFYRRIVQGVVHKHMHTQPKFGRLVDTEKKSGNCFKRGKSCGSRKSQKMKNKNGI